MASAFQTKNVRTLLIDKTPGGRTILAEVLKELDFLNLTVVHGIKEALDIIGTEDIHWIITPLETNQEFNALHLLRILRENVETSHIQTTVFFDRHEISAIPVAFERGMHSWFEKAKNKAQLLEEIRTLLHRFERYQWDTRQSSAANLRDYLVENERFEELVTVERGLVDQYKSNPNNLLLLAEAYFLNGEIEAGQATLWQTKLLDDRLEESINELVDIYLEGESLDSTEEAQVNALGLHSAVIIDSDSSMQNAIKRVLDGIGIPDIQIFSDGKEAWEWLKTNPEPDMLLTEWRLPRLPAPSLVQRIRQHGMANVPITIVSGLVSQEDLPLLQEMGINHLVNKPINKKTFLQSLIHFQVQQQEPTEQKHLISKLRTHLTKGCVQEAKGVLSTLMNETNLSDIRQTQLKGELAFHEEDYSLASKLLLESVRSGKGDTLIALNLLGKSLIKLGDFQSALECLNRAKEISPKNIERLCIISEVYVEMGDNKSAEDSIESAKKIDEENLLVVQSTAKMALENGQKDKAKNIMDQLESMDEVISTMNNRAISLTRNGELDRGVEIYQRTLESIPENRQDKRAIVIYNLALNQIRNTQYDDAMKNLEQAVSISKEFKIHKKCLSVKSQLKRAIEHGKKITLSAAQSSLEKVSTQINSQQDLEKELKKLHEERLKILKSKEDKPLYKFKGTHDNFVKTLLEKEPVFTLRKVLHKANT
ncbi:MAG: response regulator [Oligoflexales bacterium]